MLPFFARSLSLFPLPRNHQRDLHSSLCHAHYRQLPLFGSDPLPSASLSSTSNIYTHPPIVLNRPFTPVVAFRSARRKDTFLINGSFRMLLKIIKISSFTFTRVKHSRDFPIVVPPFDSWFCVIFLFTQRKVERLLSSAPFLRPPKHKKGT